MTHGQHDPRAQVPDSVLVARFRGGQAACFAELVNRYEMALRRVARSRLGREDWADDVVQETLLAAYRGINSYDPRYNFRTWLWTILLNQCNGHYQCRRGACLWNRSRRSASHVRPGAGRNGR